MRTRVKVFSTGQNPNTAGDNLTEQYEKWAKDNDIQVIKDIHTNSNGHGWMLTVLYVK